MKKGLATFFIFGIFCVGVFAQEYIIDDNPTRYWSLGTYIGDTQITTLTGGGWLDGYYDLALPTANQFYFYGKKVTHLRISTNGYIRLGFGSATGDGTNYSNDSIPDQTNPDAMVAVLWDDYDLRTQGGIYYKIASSYVIVEWRGVPHYGTSTSYNFSVVFCSHTHGNFPDQFILNYIDVTSANTTYDNGKSATIGVENEIGTIGDEYSYNTASVNDGDLILVASFVPVYDTTDFFSDGKPDITVFRPSNGRWYEWDVGQNFKEVYAWGTKGDIAVPGDYDGDGDADWCVYRPNNSKWYGSIPDFVTLWGTSGDIPVPADWDNDGITDLAVFRPHEGKWYIKYMAGGGATITWGMEGDVPMPADYDNDGKADAAVYRPSEGKWYIRKSSNPASSWVIPWGTDGDIPLATNGFTSTYSTICVFRPSDGKWYHHNQSTGSMSVIAWGTNGDVPVPYDQTGGGLSEHAVFRPQEGKWYNKQTGVTVWGTIGDKPRSRRSFTIIAPNYSGIEK